MKAGDALQPFAAASDNLAAGIASHQSNFLAVCLNGTENLPNYRKSANVKSE